MPLILYKAVSEINQAACPALTSYIKLTSGAANLILRFGTEKDEGHVPAEDARRRMAGNHVPDGTQLRIGCRRYYDEGIPDR